MVLTTLASIWWCFFSDFILKVGGNLTVDGIDYHVTDMFGEGLYESCKEVKFGTMNTRAINFVGGGAQNFKGAPQSVLYTFFFSCFQSYTFRLCFCFFFQSGLRLSVRKHHLASLVHHMQSISNLVPLSYLRWRQWTYLLIRVATHHLDALVVTALPHPLAQVPNPFLRHMKKNPAHFESVLLR